MCEISPIVKDMASAVSTAVTTQNRYWYAVFSVSILIIITPTSAKIPFSYIGFEEYCGSSLCSTISLLVLCYLIIAFVASQAHLIRVQDLANRVLDKMVIKNKLIFGENERDFFESFRKSSYGRVASLAQIALGEDKFFSDKSNCPSWRRTLGFVCYIILKLAVLLVWLVTPTIGFFKAVIVFSLADNISYMPFIWPYVVWFIVIVALLSLVVAYLLEVRYIIKIYRILCLDINQMHVTKIRRLVKVAFGLSLVGLIALMLIPQSYFFSRMILLFCAFVSWGGILFLVWRRKTVRTVLLVLSGAALLFSICPGRQFDTEDLRRDYIVELKRYEGVEYNWGGESFLGIDCSGLVRRGLINAHLKRAVTTFNPGEFRAGLFLWWNDCTAKDLRDGYRRQARQLFNAPTLNTADYTKLKSGDLAVTESGVHIMAYIGDKTWIEAEPSDKVLILKIPQNNNSWFNTPVRLLRWSVMD